MNKTLLSIVALTFAAAAAPANAAIIISEVAPWASTAANAAYTADWFELTNTGSSSVNISGWTMDDDSNNSNSALLSGVTSIGANESVVFVELLAGTDATTLINSFKSAWFGSNVPASFKIGTYTQGVAGGVGLGANGDTVNIYNGVAGTLQAKVTFGVSDATAPYQTFNNAAGLNNTAISTLSVVGTNGAFLAADAKEVGSPGSIAAVPESETYAMMLAGLAVFGAFARRRQQ